MKTEVVNEYLKCIYTEEEKRDLAQKLAENVNSLQRAEDEKKAVTSSLKSKIDGLQANVNNLASNISNGYEFRSIECEVIPVFSEKIWKVVRTDTGETIRTDKMTTTDLQDNLFESQVEGEPNEIDHI